MRFQNGETVGGDPAVDIGAPDVDDSLDPRVAGGAQHDQRAFGVHSEGVARVVPRTADVRVTGEVIEHLGLVGVEQCRPAVGVEQVRSAIGPIGGGDLVAGGAEVVDEVTTDETARTRDERFHVAGPHTV